MIKLKNIYIGVNLVLGGLFFAQTPITLPTNPKTIYTEKGIKESEKNAQKNDENIVIKLKDTLAEKPILSPKEQLEANILTMKADPLLRNANWGFVVYDTKTKQKITGYNEETPLIPASTTKLLSTDASMALLGGRFKWITQLEYSGTIDETGTLTGNLYIIGSGDPSMSTGKAGAWSNAQIISEYISKISEAGIKKINGDIVIETAVFQDVRLELPEKIVWLEHNNYYLPVGNTTNIDPKNEKIAVKAKSVFDNSKRYFYVSPYMNKMAFTDKFTTNQLITTIPAAPVTLANALKASLIREKIPIVGKVVTRITDPEPEDREFLAKYSSPTMVEIIFYTNQHSDNALAEALLKTVGFYKTGNVSLESGRETIVRHLEDKRYDFEGLNLVDGSGLSRSNRVKPISQAKFLADVMKEKYYDDFVKSLPIAGETGTLRRMFKTSNNYGQIFAKTGTLSAVKCLAGYIKTRSGRTLTFSLLINNYAGSVDQIKARMERLLEPVVDL